MDAIYEEMPEGLLDDDTYRTAFEVALGQRNLPDWMQEMVWEADAVERGFGTTYLKVPSGDSRAAYRDMEDFIETVTNPRFQGRLEGAIRGRGAFRRFKDTVADDPDEERRWFAFRDARLRERVLGWLAEEGIEPVLEES